VCSHRSFEYTLERTFLGEVFFHSAYILRRSSIYDFGGNVCPSAVKLLRPSGRLLCSASREQLISHSTLRVIDDASYCMVLQFARLQYQGLINLLMEYYLRWHCVLTLTATRGDYSALSTGSILSLLVLRISHKSNSRITLKLAFKSSLPTPCSLRSILRLPMFYTSAVLQKS
jgi:hypothetical protein